MTSRLADLHRQGKKDEAVRALLFQIKAAGLPAPLTEYRFHTKRRWRFDLAWTRLARPWRRVEDDDIYAAIEVDGGVYVNGRHTRGKGYEADCEKLNAATVNGWRVLRVTPKHIKSGEALSWIQELLK